MARINPQFQIRNPKATGLTSINLFFYFHGGTRFLYSTGIKIEPKYWDAKEQHVKKARVDEPTRGKHNWINKRIEEYKEKIDALFLEYEKKNIAPKKSLIKAALDSSFKASTSSQEIDFVQFAEIVINDSISGVRLTKKGKRISHETIKGYQTTLFHLKKVQNASSNRMNFEDIDMTFYRTFIAYFHKGNKSTNTIGKNIKNVKVFIKEAFKRGLTDNRIFENEDFAVIEEITDQIYLNMDDLKAMNNLDLADNPRLEKARDLFILACFTGLRSGDLDHLHKDNIIEDGKMIRLRMQKTGGLVVIPLNPMARGILDKYNGNPPAMISNQKLNKYIKEIGVKAEINEVISQTITKGGRREDSSHLKHKLIKVHTARRTFATNMFLAGVPAISIMKITGHKTEASFLKYIRISAEENAKMLLKHSFFS